jgi:hypothetical protein
MTQNTTGLPGGRQIQYSAPRIPKTGAPWFVTLFVTFALVLVLGVAYGFWRISNVPTPVIDIPKVQSEPPAPVPGANPSKVP